MTAAEFWKRLEFSHLVTYSFNRGPKLRALRTAAKALFQQTSSALLTADKHRLPALREQLRLLERTHNLDLLTLTQGTDAFHVTALPVVKLEKRTEALEKIAASLQAPLISQHHWLCAPVYRDALAFYDEQNRLVSVLNICFDCDRMITDQGRQIEADSHTYQSLRAYLAQLGHVIVDGEH